MPSYAVKSRWRISNEGRRRNRLCYRSRRGCSCWIFLLQKESEEAFDEELNREIEQYKADWKKASENAGKVKTAEEKKEEVVQQTTETFQPVSKFDLQVPTVEATKGPKPKDVNIMPDPDADVPPYPITDNEFGHQDDFETRELMIWADGVVTYNDGRPEPLGEEFLLKALGENWQRYFGWDEQYEDELFIRCNQMKIDWDIVKSLNKYREWRRETKPVFDPEEDEDE